MIQFPPPQISINQASDFALQTWFLLEVRPFLVKLKLKLKKILCSLALSAFFLTNLHQFLFPCVSSKLKLKFHQAYFKICTLTTS